ncbi:glycoside hydrolase family 32 protein, partial [bacterium]|nr:glycoside hydrolase family 32 protein [bacterium]
MVDNIYQEAYRPQFHFTAKENWLNDPNGLVYYKDEYYLFFQHNPKGLEWGPNTWGHAVSDDLIHWKQIEHAIEPDEMGWIWSGSAVVDWENTGGFQTGDEKTLIAFYTTGDTIAKPEKPCVQCIAYSNDLGRTWTRYERNPVLGHIVGQNRDPKVIWHEPTRKWVMSLFLDGNDYALFSSPDLKEWTHLCDINLPETSECPDIFELPVDGDSANTRWVFWGGNGNYYIGSFDGHEFQPESDVLRADLGANFYAAQTWSDIPSSDGRRLQIAWMSGGKYPDMPFNQQMSVPCELTLRTTPKGIRMYRQPVKEIESLHIEESSWSNQTLKPGENLLSGISGDLFDIHAEIELGGAAEIGFIVRGEKIKFDVSENQLSFLDRSAHLEPLQNMIRLQVLLDRTSIEVFGNDGRVSMSSCFLPDPENTGLGIYSLGGKAT